MFELSMDIMRELFFDDPWWREEEGREQKLVLDYIQKHHINSEGLAQV